MGDQYTHQFYKRVKPRKGTSNKGQEYEILLPALFSLTFFEDDSVKNFVLRSNVENFGSFDDVLITLYKNDDQEENYAFQLKHKEKQNLILHPKCLESVTKNDFAVLKYCEEFASICEREKYFFIIYTNAYFNSEHMGEVCNFDINCGTCPGKKYFYKPAANQDHCNARIYNLRVNRNTKTTTLATKEVYRNFLDKFAIYTCQQNWGEVQKTIVEQFQRIFRTSERLTATAYIDMFKYWKLHEYTKVEITKEELQIKILDLILTPHIIAPCAWNKDAALLESAFAKFDFVLAFGLSDAELGSIVSQPHFESQKDVIHQAKDLKFLTKNVASFSNSKDETDVKQKLGYYRKEKPCILKVHEGNVDAISTIVSKFKQTKDYLHFVFTGVTHSVKEKFAHFTIFENLHDLMELQKGLYEEMIKQMKISLFGQTYTYNEIFDNEEVAKQVTIHDIFRMLSGNSHLTINPEGLPIPYIPRFLSKTLVKIESMDEVFKNDLVVIKLKGNLEIKNLLQDRFDKRFLTIEEYLQETPLVSAICQKQLSSTDFEKITASSPSKTVHIFEVHDAEFLQWISTSGSIKQVKKCEIFKKTYVDEFSAFEGSQNLINVISAPAGMGKSELLKKLKNSCPSDTFPIFVNFKEHSTFFKNSHDDDEVLQHFLFNANDNLILAQVKKVFAQNRKILFFFDGLDELQPEYINTALDLLKSLSKMGFRLWVSSRSYLEEQVENHLNVFSMNIKAFSEKNQKDYITKRLEEKPNAEELVERVFKNLNTIVESRDILDIPLQLFMITEILRETKGISDDIFVLTKMFKQFFYGRYHHFLRKSGYDDWKPIKKIIDDTVKYRMQQYQIAALKSYFTLKQFSRFNLDLDRTFSGEIETEGDFLGIILKISSTNVIFHHNVIATYLVALFFSENYAKYGPFLEEVLFKDEHFYLRLFFDLILAEDSPPHVAVLYRNVEVLKKYTNDLYAIDKGGRSTLHLACSYGCTHTIMRDSMRDTDRTIEHVNKLRKDDHDSRKVIDLLLTNQVDLFSKDYVYQWSCLDFAEKTLSILPLDTILERIQPQDTNTKEKILNLNMIKENPLGVLISCTIFSYHLLFKIMFQITKLKAEDTTDLLHKAAVFNNWKIVNIMIDNSVEIQTATWRGKTILHQACTMGHLELVMLLIVKNADVNAVDQLRRTPLHLAAANGQMQTVKTLLKHKARLNCVDKFGRTPLHLAVDKGKTDLVKYLVDVAHDDVNKKAWNGRGPLQFAIIQEHVDIVQFLLEKNVNVNSVDNYGMKALHLATKQPNLDILKMILEKSECVDVATSDGRTSLHLAAEIGNVAACEYFIQKKANIHSRDDRGRSVLHWAVIMGQLEIADLLLKNDVSVDVVDNIGHNCLHWAAELGHLELVKLLVMKKESLIHEKTLNGSTALHWAAHNGHDRVVEFLIQYGADVDAADKEGRSPLYWAALEGRSSTVELLLQKNASDVSISGISALDFAKRRRRV